MNVALIALAVTLLGTVIASTWRFSALATKLLEAVRQLERKDSEMEARIKNVDEIPSMRLEVEHMKKNHSLIPKAMERLAVVETKVGISKELRAIRRSRPDTED